MGRSRPIREDGPRYRRPERKMALSSTRNDGAGVVRERLVTDHTEDKCDLSRVRSDRDPGVFVLAGVRIKHFLAASVLRRAHLSGDAVPEVVLLNFVRLSVPDWQRTVGRTVDVRARAAVVAGEIRDTFAKGFSHGHGNG